MILIPLVALFVGILLGWAWAMPVASVIGSPYIAVAVLAGLDSIFGGVRSALEGKFYNDVFITGFISNIIIAFSLGWLGDRIGINLFLAAALVMGWRIFTNISLIRRFALTKWHDARQRKRLEAEHNATQSVNVS